MHAALRDDPNFELNRVDLDRDGPHYTLDTVKIIHQQNPMDELFYLIGGDSLHDFPNWYKPNQLLAEVTGLGVMRRPGDQIDLSRLEMALPGVIQKINFVDAPLLEIASHEIRSRIAAGRPYRYYLLPAVYECIKEKGYYLK